MNYFVECFKKYAQFSGRSRRAEYWTFYLITILIYFVLLGLAAAMRDSSVAWLMYGVAGVFILAAIIPMLSATVRRLHDGGHSGWTYLIGFIPLVGSIILLVYLLQDSQPGENKWGANPKGVSAA